jgi:hypothetical protein
MYYRQCGHWMVYAYSQEGFDFYHPRLVKLLFSYSNGFFVYAPVMFIAALGIFTFVGKDAWRFFTMCGFLLVVDWVLSSWWAWTYGGAYGMRPMVEYLPVFGMLLAYLLQWIARWRIAAAALIILIMIPLMALVQFQTRQYRESIFAWDRMTEKMYWRIFLKTGHQFRWIFSEGPAAPVPETAERVYHYQTDLEAQDTIIPNWESITEERAFSGKRSSLFRVDRVNPAFWRRRVDQILPDSAYAGKTLWLHAKMKFWLDDYSTATQLIFIQQRGDQLPVYQGPFIIHLIDKEKEWVDYEYNMMLQPLQPGDVLTVLPVKYNNDSMSVYIDDIDISIYAQ